MISIVCVYNDEITLKDYLLKSLENQTSKHELILIDNTQGKFKSAAGALNWGRGKAKGRYIMFVHQDVALCSDSWLENAETLVDSIPNLGIAGVGGARRWGSPGMVQCITNIAHGMPAMTVPWAFPPQKPEKVHTVDECLVIIPRTVFDMLQFDEEVCDDWHLYAVDYSLSVALLGLDVYAIPAFIHHRSTGIPNKTVWQLIFSIGMLHTEFYQTLGKLLKKHRRHTDYVYSTCGCWSTSYPLILRRIKEVRPEVLPAVRQLVMPRNHSKQVIVETKNIALTDVEIEKIALAEDPALCHVDFVNYYPLVQLGSPIIIDAQHEQMVTISGWAIDHNAGEVAGGVFINIDGQIDIPAFYGMDRHDLADYLKNNSCRFSGFWALIATSVLGEGQHILSLMVVTADKKKYYKHHQNIILEVR